MNTRSGDTGGKTTLQQLRESGDLTQQEVADRINALLGIAHGPVTAHMVSRWERGAVIPKLEYRRLLARIFNVTVADLDLTPICRQRPTSPFDFLDESVEASADPRVAHSQDEWRTIRGALNARRLELTGLAATVYPPTSRLADTRLVAGPGWIPDEPVPLDAIELVHDSRAPAPVVYGCEPESAHVRPLASLGRPYARYTAAIRDLDPPRLFDNRFSWRLTDLDWTAGKGRLHFGSTTYFEAMDVCEALAHEMAYMCLDGGGRPLGRSASLRDLPFRRRVGDPFDLARRPTIPSISTLTIRAGDEPTFLLHRRDSRRVAIAGGMLHVIPSGIFQPSSVLPVAMDTDFDLWHNIAREYSEELLGMAEADGNGRPVDYGAEPFASLAAARASGRLRVSVLGVALDALTLAAEIMTVAVFDPDLFDHLSADFVTRNDEGTVVGERLAFDEPTVAGVLGSGRMAPAGAGCLSLAWYHRAAVLG